jgi:signal transduction histidine kinase
MRFKPSIFFKLLLFILPLVCLPIAIVGYLAIQASVERVNHLVRQEQMVQVEAAAQKINDVFHNCRTDLGTITGLPLLEDFNLARTFRLEAEARFNRDNIQRLFLDFLDRTPFYWQLRYLDRQGRELIKVRRGQIFPPLDDQAGQAFFRQASALPAGQTYFSPLVNSPARGGYVVHSALSSHDAYGKSTGLVVIDLDFEKIIQIVRSIHAGQQGYGFLVDQQGRNIVHPHAPPYTYGPESGEASLRSLLADMTAGGAGWQRYTFQNQEKVAAYAPIPAMSWSLGATIPVTEFRQEADAIQRRVIQVVVVALILAVGGVSILSYNLLKPVRSLVTATNRMARGDLAQEIPVRSRDELGELTQSFNRMVRNLARIQNELVRSEKLVSLGRLSAGVAHEIRNPLNAMAGAIVHLQRRRPEDPLIAEYTKLVAEEIDRLAQFVTDFLYFARQAPPRLVPTNLNDLVVSVQNLFQAQAQRQGIHFHSLLDQALPALELDPHQMEQVLVNLVVNAMDALPQGGEVTFTTAWQAPGPGLGQGGEVRLSVEDNGVGIPPENLDAVFDPFFTSKETGTGLGLTLSLGIVESHGGTLEVHSRPGQGTRMTICLPFRAGQPREVQGEA